MDDFGFVSWTDEAHFHVQFGNTQNCRIWVNENPFPQQPAPLYSIKISLQSDSMATLIVLPFSFERGLTYSVVMRVCYMYNQWKVVWFTFEHPRRSGISTGSLWAFICKIAHLINDVAFLDHQFGNDMIFSCHFSIARC